MADLSNRDLIAVANRAVTDFERGIAKPWRLVSLIKKLIARLEATDD